MKLTLQMIADDFAASAPIGRECLFFPTKPFNRDHAIKTRIRSEPWIVSSSRVIVKVDGIAGGVSIEHIAFENENNLHFVITDHSAKSK